MSHLREVFPILENIATQQGVNMSQAQPGQAPAGRNGLMALAFKDAAGNLVLPSLTSEGKVPVDLEGAGISKSASSDGEIAGALTETVVAEVALTVDKTYGKIHANVHCFLESVFYLYKVDDAVETVIGHAIVGPGQFSFKIDLGAKEIVAGSTGTQKLSLRALNLHKVSDFMGDVACLEFAG